jgi:predicted ATP-dependent protease
VKKGLAIVPVATVDEVLRLALVRMPEPIPVEEDVAAVVAPPTPAQVPSAVPLN